MTHLWALLLEPVVIFIVTGVVQELGKMLEWASARWWVAPLFLSIVIPMVLMGFAVFLCILAFAVIPVGTP